MVLKAEPHQNRLEGSPGSLGPFPRDACSGGSLGPEICLPHQIPGDGEAAGLAPLLRTMKQDTPVWWGISQRLTDIALCSLASTSPKSMNSSVVPPGWKPRRRACNHGSPPGSPLPRPQLCGLG